MLRQPGGPDAAWQELLQAIPVELKRDQLIADIREILAEPLRTPKQKVEFHSARARCCREFTRALMERPAMAFIENRLVLLEQLAAQEQNERRLADLWTRAAKPVPPARGKQARHPRGARFARDCELLQAWKKAGGSTRHTRPRWTEGKAQVPSGPVITFLRAAHKLAFDNLLAPDTASDIVVEYDRLHWGAAQLAGAGAMLIDDAGVTIIKATPPPDPKPAG